MKLVVLESGYGGIEKLVIVADEAQACGAVSAHFRARRLAANAFLGADVLDGKAVVIHNKPTQRRMGKDSFRYEFCPMIDVELGKPVELSGSMYDQEVAIRVIW